MSDELVDLVDVDDRVIGTVRKLDTDGDASLIHREVAILVHREGELLWQLRSAARTVMPATWDVACAGHVRAGEAPAAAARRELHEELGIELDLEPIERRLVRASNETYLAHVFAGAAPAGLELRPDPDEVAAVEWCDEASYLRWLATGRRLSPVACELAEAFWAAASHGKAELVSDDEETEPDCGSRRLLPLDASRPGGRLAVRRPRG